MYSTLAISENSNKSGRIMGTHQQLDKIARVLLEKGKQKRAYFPSIDEILRFEGIDGPDGLKRKSPGMDEPLHFIIPGHDDGKLITIIHDHAYNLNHALEVGNNVRAGFEAAWMAHAITDGLTPAHHFPLIETQKELMTEKEFIKIFGIPVKGIMHGRNVAETLRNNWLYWGANGYMSKHVAFEYGVAVTMTAMPAKAVTPKITNEEFNNATLDDVFYNALKKVASLDMYSRFVESGWTTELALETKEVLLPEIIKAITLSWYTCIDEKSK